ncbi:MAG: CoA-transferase [Roseiarcus sp.]
MGKVKDLGELNVPLKDNDTLIIGGFADDEKSDAVFARLDGGLEAKALIVVDATSAADTSESLKKLIRDRARKLITPSAARGKLAAEVVCETSPQNILLERIRAGGAGIPAFYIAAEGASADRPTKMIDGKLCVVETGITGDVGVIRVKKADTDGNCYIPAAQRMIGYIAYATKFTVVVSDEIVPVGQIDPEYISLPGILVTAVAQV